MSIETGRLKGCYVNTIHTYLIRYIHNVSFVASLCIFGTDTWALQTLTVSFSEILHTSARIHLRCEHLFFLQEWYFLFPVIPLCLSAVLVSAELFHFILLQGYLVSLVFSR